MADLVMKPFIPRSCILTLKPSCHFTKKVENIKKRLTEYRHDITDPLVQSLQKSMNLKQMFDDVLMEYDVEVVWVSEDIPETFDYIRKKRNAGVNVLAHVLLEVETRNDCFSLTSKNKHLLQEDFPCEVLFDIQEAGEALDETVSERLEEFQPLVITKQRSEVINGWLEKYQEALRNIVAVCKDKNKISKIANSLIEQNVTEIGLMNCLDFGKTTLTMKLQNGNTLKNCVRIIIDNFSKIIGENVSEAMNELVCDAMDPEVRCKQTIFCMKDRYGREFVDRIVKMIKVKNIFDNTNWGESREDVASTLFTILNENDETIIAMLTESMYSLHGYIKSVLEEENKSIQGVKLLIPDVLENQQCRKLTSVCCGSVDTTKYSIGFRAESFDQIYVKVHRTVKAVLDQKTVEEATRDTQYIDEYIHKNSLEMKTEEKRQLYKLVNNYTEKLMERHSNLHRVGISPVILSSNSRIVKRLCIVMYCSCKGIMPEGEPKFPREIENTPVDVREDYCSLFSIPGEQEYNDPLRMGISIGGKDMNDAGTLGPFVIEAENESSLGFLTCQHVFPSAEVGSQVVQPSGVHLKAGILVGDTICGEIKSMCMEDIEYNGKPTSVDVAYVIVNQRKPNELKLLDIQEMLINDLGGTLHIGQPVMDMEMDTKVYKLGQTTMLTIGNFQTSLKMVKIDKTPYKNVYLVSSHTEFAKRGDSGSAVFMVKDKTVHVIGLLLGGANNKKECYVIPIGAALHALQKVGPPLEIHKFNDETGNGVHDSVENSPGDNDEDPPGDNDEDPTGDNDEDPTGDNDNPPCDNDDDPTGDNDDDPPGDNGDDHPGDNDDDPPGDNGDDPPGDNDDDPPGDNDDDPTGDKGEDHPCDNASSSSASVGAEAGRASGGNYPLISKSVTTFADSKQGGLI